MLAETVKFPLTLSTKAVFTFIVPIATKPIILLQRSDSAIESTRGDSSVHHPADTRRRLSLRRSESASRLLRWCLCIAD